MAPEMRASIGEILNRLKDEFPDVTISKIRFLESEGLISPDRTDSGYRQFTEDDLERLRYILRAQRDRYLPLKVIGEELEEIDAGRAPADADGSQPLEAAQEQPEASPEPPRQRSPRPSVSSVEGDVHLSGRELAGAADLEIADVRSLQEHGLLPPGDVFDGDGLAAAKAAAGLLAEGLEARHLRMYRQFADREVALHQQLVQPILRQRNPDARQRAGELLDGLAEHGHALHAALLRRELRDLLGS